MEVLNLEELGRFIRETREKKKLSLQDLHENTKIRVLYLKAIEEGNFNIIPGVVYLKGFLRNIARELNIDFNELLETYSEAIEAFEAESDSHIYDEAVVYESKSQIKRKRWLKSLFWIILAIGALAAGAYYYLNYMQ